LTLPAIAADVSVLGTYTPSRPVYSWTGCRIGANIGGGSARTSWNDPFGTLVGGPIYLGDHTASGVVGGGQLGCDYQVGRFVFGIQGLYDLTGMKASNIEGQPAIITVPATVTGPGGSFAIALINETFIQSTANVTARIGYAVLPNVLLYAKAGVARNHNLYNISTPNLQVRSREITVIAGLNQPVFTLPPSFIVALGNDSRVGPLIGTGFEWAVFGTDVSLFLEYDYMHFGTKRVTLLGSLTPQIFPLDITQNVNMVLFGINYRFFGGP
jgi:outer membrane immunogenic protein